MQNPDKLAEKIGDIITTATDNFVDGLEESQKKAYNRLLLEVRELKLDSQGRIKRTVENIKILRRVNKSIEETLITPSYQKKVKEYLGAFNEVSNEQAAYFKLLTDAFTDETLFLEEVKIQSIETAVNSLLESGIHQNFTQPIKDILMKNITTGARFDSLTEEIRTFIIGNTKIPGKMVSYAKGITNDSLHIFSGQYNQVVTQDLGLVFYKYSGGLKDTSRDFCESRAGRYYHKEEIKEWADNKWEGKMKGTTEDSIFYNVGGYGCSHVLIPVSQAMVPDYVVNRAKQKGYL